MPSLTELKGMTSYLNFRGSIVIQSAAIYRDFIAGEYAHAEISP